jgi:8-oxo-dGTP pyrophosphatase MutT (NUDIX family)
MTDGPAPGEVRAAGVVPLRRIPALQVAIVHRPRYDDWSFPKGKVDPGETDEAAALRELEEETGLTGELGRELPAAQYIDGRGRPKTVRYWFMDIAASAPDAPGVPNEEVDELRWLAPAAAEALLSYDHDRRLLRHLDGPAGSVP